MEIMLTREQFQELYAQGPDAVFTVVEALQATVMAQQQQLQLLTARVKELENQLGKNSQNSSKPPSSDGFRKPVSLRPKTGRKPGAQKGHQGCTLALTETPDLTVVHDPCACACCGTVLAAVTGQVTPERRQVLDLPPLTLQTTEHRVREKVCPECGQSTTGTFPLTVASSVQYGPRISALSVYLNACHFLPYARIGEMYQDLFGFSLSPGTLETAQQRASGQLAPVLAFITAQLTQAALLHADESGVRIGAKLHWLHTVGTRWFTFYHWHRNRGKVGMDAGGILPSYAGRIVHDFWKPYFLYACPHALCVAHLLRELTALRDQDHQTWAATMIGLLVEMKAAVEAAQEQGRTRLSLLEEGRFEERYRKVLAEGYQANPPPEPVPKQKGRVKQNAARNLLDRLQTYAPQVLAFLYDFTVPFDNNLAERDIRMIKVKLKVSGGFRSEDGATAFCRIRSYLSTLRKQGRPILSALESLFRGEPVYPKALNCPNALPI